MQVLSLFHPVEPQLQILKLERGLDLILIFPGLIQLQNPALILCAYLLLINEQHIGFQEVFIEQHPIDGGLDARSPNHRLEDIEHFHCIVEQTWRQI